MRSKGDKVSRRRTRRRPLHLSLRGNEQQKWKTMITSFSKNHIVMAISFTLLTGHMTLSIALFSKVLFAQAANEKNSWPGANVRNFSRCCSTCLRYNNKKLQLTSRENNGKGEKKRDIDIICGRMNGFSIKTQSPQVLPSSSHFHHRRRRRCLVKVDYDESIWRGSKLEGGAR